MYRIRVELDIKKAKRGECGFVVVFDGKIKHVAFVYMEYSSESEPTTQEILDRFKGTLGISQAVVTSMLN